MIRSQQRRSQIANWRRTVYDDDPEPVPIQHGIEAVPIASGLEQIPAEHPRQANAPQVVLGQEEKETLAKDDHEPSQRRSLVCGMPRKWFWILVAAVAVAVAIAVAVGVAIRVREAQNTSLSPSATISASTSTASASSSTAKPTSKASTSGAFKSTGMALIDWGVGAVDLFIYFQDYTGKIRSSELKGNAWLKGPTADMVVGSNVKNGTPISAISYIQNMTMTAHLFYIDSFNVIQEAIKSSTSSTWVNGSLGASNWQASESSSVDLAACYNDQYYNGTGNGAGIRLFYGVGTSNVHELSYSFGTQEWRGGYSFAGVNGEGGITCAGAGSGISYLYLLNQQNQLELWWHDFDSSKPNDPKHPSGTWVKGPAANMSVRAKSAVSYNNYVYFQDPSDNIIGIQPSPAAENSGWNSSFHVGGDVEALPGTRIASITSFPTADTPSELQIFFQTNGSDITEYLRGQNGGQWSLNSVPVG